MPIYRVEINNWKKYAGREGQANQSKRAWWFKLSNRIGMDMEFKCLNEWEKLAWIFLLCERSIQNKKQITINDEIFEQSYGLCSGTFNSLSKKAQSFYWVNVEKCGNLNVTRKIPRSRIDKIREEENIAELENVPKAAKAASKQYPDKLYQSWISMYGTPFVEKEIKRADAWMLANPRRAPKSQFGRFYNSWLQRSWEWQRRSNPPGKEPKEVKL